MSAILPPAKRLWWKHPLDRVEGTWIVISLIWCLIMFAMMVGWHVWGQQNLSTETYRTTPELFMAKTQAMVDKYKVRTEKDENSTPVVAPPPATMDRKVVAVASVTYPRMPALPAAAAGRVATVSAVVRTRTAVTLSAT